jgi:hypothetical protein
VTDDIDGGARDAQPDIGADGFGAAQAPDTSVYLPIIVK